MTPRVCGVPWCSALCDELKGSFCAIHRTSQEIRPMPLDDDEQFTYVSMIGGTARELAPLCKHCDGTGECVDCDGTGEHECGHVNCYDVHDCGSCEGSGDCEYCHGAPGGGEIVTTRVRAERPRLLAAEWDKDAKEALAYLRAVYLPSWIPPAEREVA